MSGLAGRTWWLLLFLVVLAAPLPLASVNTEWCMPLAAACMALGVVAGVIMPAVRGEGVSPPRSLVPLALIVLWVGFQLVPLPDRLLRILSPERLRLPAPPGEGGPLALSVNRGETLEQGLFLLSLLYLLWGIVRSRSRAPFRLLAVVGVAHAILALVLSETGGTSSVRVLWIQELPDVLTPFGTYVNKNHFAGLMVVTGGACLGLLARRLQVALRRAEDLSLRARIAAVTGRGFFRLLAPALGFLVIAVAIFASGSRGGAGAFALAFLAVPLGAGTVVRIRTRWPLLFSIPVIALAAILATAGSSKSVVERFLPHGRYMNRPRLWKNVLGMAAHYPVAGTGLGTFPDIFPRYQEFDSSRQFTHAEGDWVQFLAETGLVGLLLLASFVFLTARRFILCLKTSPPDRWLLVGAAVGLVGIGLQGLVDVSMHIPANQVATTVLLGGVLARLGTRGGTRGAADGRKRVA